MNHRRLGDDTVSTVADTVRKKQLTAQQTEDPYQKVLLRVRQRASEVFVPAELQKPGEEVRRKLGQLIEEELTNYQEVARASSLAPLVGETEELKTRMERDILGLGPLEELLADPTVEDIVINGPQEVNVFKEGKWRHTDIQFASSGEVLTIINRAIAATGRQASMAHPITDARLPDGSRVNVICTPLAEPQPAVTIRLFPKKTLTLEDMVRRGTLTPQAAYFLKLAVECRMSILIAGGTAAGKTTLANALADCIPSEERLVVIEDTRELRIRQEWGEHPNVEFLTVRYPSGEGEPGIYQDQLVKAALRMRPSRIIVGEARGGEVLDLLMAANTGHEGMITTIHANSSVHAISRLYQLMQLAELEVELRPRMMAEWIAQAIQLVVFLELRTGTNRRQVTEITEFTGQLEGDVIIQQPLFQLQDGELARTPYRLFRNHLLERYGHHYDEVAGMDRHPPHPFSSQDRQHTRATPFQAAAIMR